MPEFYDMYNDDGLEIFEGDSTLEWAAVDSFMVDDDTKDEMSFTVEETDEPETYDTVPGSHLEYVKFDEPEAEVREKNWETDRDPSMFVSYLKDKLTKIPRHSGNTIPGCERAAAYIKDLDGQASKAMRSDYKGEIDEEELDKIRKDMQGMIDRLENHIERLQKSAGVENVRFVSEGFCKTCESNAPMWRNALSETEVCMNCESEEKPQDLQKTAGTPAVNVFMTPFERAVVGTIINAKVSGGRNIEEVYEKLKNKYNFTPREELAFQQLIADHGYPVYKDRGLLNEPADPASGDNVEWQTNYHA